MSETSLLWCANGFYGADDIVALYGQIPKRASCRCFRSAPDDACWQALTEALPGLALPGVRLVPGLCQPELFRPFGGHLMKFENVRRFLAVIGTDSPEGAINAGVSGEMAMLKACSLGMAGTWVSGTYKRKAVPVALGEQERLFALLALGVPPDGFAPGPRKRKPLKTLLGGTPDVTNALLMDVALAVQAAPSAINLQPWRLRQEADKTIVLSVPLPFFRLDLGIAAAHALLALGQGKGTLRLGANGLSVSVTPEP